ncbi:MAG: IMP cyclohydrolase [Spirochaetes bacterium GWD1_61_31]|nr:MAG: IMP cyclohydrolase [Spirochaetes bacterium GWB1_60_80]OHD31505.1 MAG: IMP cyclohydrolase [Spirochaetes bacterium GWC1_61_12]OHD43282.1 MAG: IMP cyclohydrolase [Spirochaetes bacterium GWD1_61_31]OHD45628.1 MAG: IMP cyclohydrolase [Spirochaetes bacterium GWE1_60_18]OHD60479.1 MAG: IMP cyclohydrolase [Spirochaetes bacterium GWF1_60_12]HAP44720.1 IMP cyclohydrolase [Spirochaetaceae bacterium]
MKTTSLASQYKDIGADAFPVSLEIVFRDQTGQATSLRYQKVEWLVDGQRRGLRYGENPDQSAALYAPVGGNISLADGSLIQADGGLVTSAELLQFGKHPGKTNLTDVDAALNILRYLMDKPACAIMKHNNPSGVAVSGSLAEAYHEAYFADRVAAFGGAVVLNRELDLVTAAAIAEAYCEVVAAPAFAPGVLEIFARKKNLRVMCLPNIAKLASYAPVRNIEFKTLLDGGCVAQLSFVSAIRAAADLLPAETTYKDRLYCVQRQPTEAELADMLFGWAVECGVTSNSVIFVKDGRTVGIGTGEQDRVGVAEIAVYKALRKLEDRLCWERYGQAWNEWHSDPAAKSALSAEAHQRQGGLPGSVMVSDAFFPFRDGLLVGVEQGVRAVLQPGGSLRDWDVIQACNERGVAMKFTGQRCFRH